MKTMEAKLDSFVSPAVFNAAPDVHVCQARDGLRPGPRTMSWRGQRSVIEYPCIIPGCSRRNRPVKH